MPMGSLGDGASIIVKNPLIICSQVPILYINLSYDDTTPRGHSEMVMLHLTALVELVSFKPILNPMYHVHIFKCGRTINLIVLPEPVLQYDINRQLNK